MKKLLNNFLTSGHSFTEDEYELHSKFILTNIFMLLIGIFVAYLSIMLFLDNKFFYGIENVVFLFIIILSFFAIRVNQHSHKIVLHILIFISLILIGSALVNYPQDKIRIAWYIPLIISSFFIGGFFIGSLFTFLTLASLLLLRYFFDIFENSYIFGLSLVIVILSSLMISFYEKREKIAKLRLEALNNLLKGKVKQETEKLMEQKEAYRELAHYDSLTSLPNRTLFYDHLQQATSRAERSGKKFALLFIDLDNFKEINDLLGHQIGDKVLKRFADRLGGEIRKSDLLSRLGGDEFTVIVENISDVTDVVTIAQKLKKSITKPIVVENHEFLITSSIGASMYPDDSTNIDELIKCADTAMYSAKKDGRDLIHFYKPQMTEKLIERTTLETYIRRGIELDEFVVYYQPIMYGNNEKLAGLEALVRWNHPDLGLVSPADFIPIAETSGLIIPLGEKILEMVSDDIIEWHQQGFDPGFVSVNLSVKQLSYRGLMKNIKEVLKKVSFRDDWLEFEITESYTFQNPEKAIKILRGIRRLGVSLSIDDFGTGYSSLSYLKKLPVNKLKIDQSFINGIPKNEEDKLLVRTIVIMAQNFGLQVVAEGIETEEQKVFLQQIHCNMLQGYLFEKPLSTKQFEKIMEYV